MRIRKFALAVVLLSFGAQSVYASDIADEQWRYPGWQSPTYHRIVIQESIPAFDTYSHLFAEFYPGDNKFARYICTSTTSENCANADVYSYEAQLPVCMTDSDLDCIESVESIDSSGNTSKGKFLRYSIDSHFNNFKGNSSLGIPENANAGVWELSNAPSSAGTNYVVTVGIAGRVDPKKGDPSVTYNEIIAKVEPVESIPGLLKSLGGCWQDPTAPGRLGMVIANTTCGGVADDYDWSYPKKCDFADGTKGSCFSPVSFPKDIKYSLSIRFSKEPLGWIHGRITDPEIQINKTSLGTLLKVTASPVKVPTFFIAGDWANLPPATQDWFKNDFPNSNYLDYKEAGGTHAEDPTIDTEHSMVGVRPNSYGTAALNIIRKLANDVNNRAKVAPTVWTFRTLLSSQLVGANSCITNGTGLKGIVSTNSTAYSQGAPEFDGTSLNYKVASLHYLPDGSEFKSSYDLTIRSDVARCLYGFTNAPVVAKVEIINENGSSQLATTTMVERNGWIYLSAKNFTFSSPQIRVTLSQETPAKVTATQINQKSIRCVKGKVTKVIKGVNPKCPSGYTKSR